MPVVCSHRPHASDRPGSPAARRAGHQPVEEGVRRRVVALSGRAHERGSGGEDDERVEVETAGQLVEVPHRVHLRREHPGQPLRGQRPDHPVVQHTRHVHHTGQAVLAGTEPTAPPPGHGRTRRRPPPTPPRPARSARPPAPRTPSASGPRRLASTRRRTPCRATRCRATRAPSDPVPPVTRTVPSGPNTAGASGA